LYQKESKKNGKHSWVTFNLSEQRHFHADGGNHTIMEQLLLGQVDFDYLVLDVNGQACHEVRQA
jgi:hypothetical protein